jgi:Holliday junction resolvase RusA-like endonuclease
MNTTEKIKLIVLGEPISKANAAFAKFSRAEGTIKIHIPDKFMEYEALIKAQAEKELEAGNLQGYNWGPVSVTIDYYLSERRVKDLPNLPKTTCDALNGVLYKDDSQIVSMILNKFYSKENPRVEITVFRPLNWEQNMEMDLWSLPPTLTKPPKKLVLKTNSSAEVKTPIKSSSKPRKQRAKSKRTKASTASKSTSK